MIAIACGMPRSGSTLQYNIMRLLVEHSNCGKGLGWMPEKKLDWYLNESTEYLNSSIMVVKAQSISADAIQLMAANPKSAFCAYSCRDPRDAVHSMQRKFGYNFNKCVKLIDKSFAIRASLVSSQISIVDQSYHLLRYGLSSAVEELGRSLALNLPASSIEEIVSQLSVEQANKETQGKKFLFEALRRFLSGRLGTKPPLANDDLLYHADHISPGLGNTGQWKTTLSAEENGYLRARYEELIRSNCLEIIDWET